MILQSILFGMTLFVAGTLFYEGIARSNMRRLVRIGLPLFRRTIPIQQEILLVDHLESLQARLNPDFTSMPQPGGLARFFLPTAVPPSFILLPVTEDEMIFRRGFSERGRLVSNAEDQWLRLTGFFIWPSRFVPIILLFIAWLFPPFILALVLYGVVLVWDQRRIYQLVASIVAQEFT